MILLAGDFKNSGAAVTWELLRQGKSALEAIEPGIRAVEVNEEDPSVGRGGYPNALGVVELDAAVMDGRTRESGAVGALQGFKHPISIAYEVKRRLPHVLLVGEGAARFAEEIGAERSELLTDAMRGNWLEWSRRMGLDPQRPEGLIQAVTGGKDPQRSGGTTVYLAQDADGNIAAATSTSGWAWKYPGRLGDSPIAGAGFYADNRYGAAACTGTGELSIRTGLARMTVAYLKMGIPVEEAVKEALSDVRELPNHFSGITLYAIDASGGHYVGYIPGDGGHVPHYYVASGDDRLPVRAFAIE
ncbi:N(4)-(beta-N-acetylglucosaminyl)-L-asparaginase [Cohnella caldifontis]|uniref:N(4)-(beta-N-acetylglucosaminyl)-L-asparaginase n=1 Tax=Cohnella caldifontis TaxID=3027471 RepID=UPI0023EA7DE5|nr:N(4)-(beta-N-acetylglucosaminyl)-L-asparaginase [Cohnella sp. YIM B05605]